MNGDVRFSLNDVPLSLKADVELFGWNVCLGPIADIALTLGDSLPQSIRIGFSVHTAGDVRYWPKAGMPACSAYVRF